MAAKLTRWTDPAHAEFVRQRGKILGFQSQALWREFCAEFNVSPGLIAFRNFGLRIKSELGPEASRALDRQPQAPAAPDLETAVQETRERKQRDYEKQLLKELLVEKSATDQIIEAIRDLTPRIPPAKIQRLPSPATKGRAQTGLLLFSDLHVGAHVREDETGGYGHYDYETFKKRLARLRDGVRSITARERQNCPIDHLVIAALGDNVEGDDIFGAQSQMIDLDLMAQVLMCARDQAQFIVDLLDTYKKVTYAAVTGNHGRIGKKGQRKRHVNWDYLISHMVAMLLAEHKDRVEFLIPKAPFLALEVEGWRFILRHGDGIKSSLGIPHYGIQRSTGRWIQIQAAQQQFFSYMLMGHFHVSNALGLTGVEVLMNGSFVGTTEFSVEVMESITAPSQTFCFVHPEYGVAARYPMLLEKPKKVA